MKLGVFSISINVLNIDASKLFYEKLGFKVFAGDIKHCYLIMKNEGCIVGLFQGMFEKNIMTFNPGWDENAQHLDSFTDIRKIQRQLKGKDINIEKEVDKSTSGPASFMIVDPDGNTILLDQHV